MKKYLLSLLFITPLSLQAQQKADSVKLKNGKVVAGYIYKMDDGKIYLAGAADSLVFTADEVQTIMFCRASVNHYATATSSSLLRRDSADSNCKPCGENSQGMGIVTFTCSNCSQMESLKIMGKGKTGTASNNYHFINKKGKSNLFYSLHLIPGEYNWIYTAADKKETTGEFVVIKSEERNILLPGERR